MFDDEAKKARRDYAREYRKRNRDKMRAYNRAYYAANRERIREQQADYWKRKGMTGNDQPETIEATRSAE